MPQKIDVYNLGEEGVDVTNSPLHISDGALVQAQNVQTSGLNAQFALKKRDGITNVTTSSTSNPILSFLNVPFPSPVQITFRYSGTAQTWRALASNGTAAGGGAAVGQTASLSAGAAQWYSGVGGDWQSVPVPQNNTWSSVAYSPTLSIFAAVSPDGANKAMSSPTGETWTARTIGPVAWDDVVWADTLGLFVAVGSSSVSGASTSPDGTTWTARTTPNLDLNAVGFSPTLPLLVAVGNSGSCMTSPNGLTWTSRTMPTQDWTDVCWSDDLNIFAAVASSGTGNRVATSPDGITWTSQASAGNNTWVGVVWLKDRFIALSSDGDQRYMESFDGETWVARSIKATHPSDAGNDHDWTDLTKIDDDSAMAISGTDAAITTTIHLQLEVL